MPSNPRWYPQELPALAQSSSSTSALDVAVRNLQGDSRAQSIRQALSRRSAGVLQAAEQNRGAIIIGSLMPVVLDPVIRAQPATQTAPAVGTVGYVFGMGGGSMTDLSADKVTFATDVITGMASKTNFGRKQRGGASRLISGFLAGGSSAADGQSGQGEIEEFLFATESATSLPSILPFFNRPSMGGFAGRRAPVGFSSLSHAFFVESWTAQFNRVARIGFDSKSVSLIPANFSPATHHGAGVSVPSLAVYFGTPFAGSGGVYSLQFSTESISFDGFSQDSSGAARQALGNGINAWVFSGRRSNPTWNYRYNITSKNYSRIAADMPAASCNAACVGSSSVGYLCGGTLGSYHVWNSWFTTSGMSSVHKFTFATEALTAAPNPLSLTRSHPVGISNFSGAFV